jgi:ubiquinone/menaquinone biosynthesis C-methylase UbiE
MSDYLQVVESVYADAAQSPDSNLCCTASPVWRLPGLVIPQEMLVMNYGCGSTVDPRDLRPTDTIVYVGVGGGLEALQFAYFTRRAGSVIAVDPVAEMRDRARTNFDEAARLNAWFRPEFVSVLDGSALALPVPDGCATIVAQNCLFNIFTPDDFSKALAEVIRVLKPGGMFSTSDPITPTPLPAEFAANTYLRARCLSGCTTLAEYLAAITRAGFGRVEIRSKIPYRYLHPREFPPLSEPVMLESVEVAAYKTPEGPVGPAIFTGRTATYVGPEQSWDDDHGNALRLGIPTPISDNAAERLSRHPDIILTASTYRSRGGCC